MHANHPLCFWKFSSPFWNRKVCWIVVLISRIQDSFHGSAAATPKSIRVCNMSVSYWCFFQHLVYHAVPVISEMIDLKKIKKYIIYVWELIQNCTTVFPLLILSYLFSVLTVSRGLNPSSHGNLRKFPTLQRLKDPGASLWLGWWVGQATWRGNMCVYWLWK